LSIDHTKSTFLSQAGPATEKLDASINEWYVYQTIT